MKVLVIGETCRDILVYGVVNRICPEAPVAILKTSHTEENLGMAANVKNNLESLRPDWEINLYTNKSEIIKKRYIDVTSNNMVLREDIGDKIPEDKKANLADFAAKLKEIGNSIESYDAIVISDYHKGFLSEAFITVLVSMAKCPIYCDTKKILTNWCHGIDFVKINQHELENNKEHLGPYTRLEFLVGSLIVTKGSEGATLYNKNEITDFPIENRVREVFDVSGAGDSFLAGLVVKFLEEENIGEAVKYANKCASTAVSHKGIVAVKKEWVDT